ncbi:MAG: VWA domain-containing protein [Deltaproteobacteria bacterium]|nr:VWA domain-containing protein [Deltaproteobacteria bacterium]
MSSTMLRRLLLCLLLGLLALAALPTSSASAQGILLPNGEGAAPLRQTEQRVHLQVTDDLTVAHVTHEFRNETDTALEAIYYFTLPKGATTTDFAMWMDGKRIKGEVLPRERARAVYDSIVSRLRDPALLETSDGDLFTASIYPIPPRGTQRIEVEFALPNLRKNGLLQLHYPISRSEVGAAERLFFEADIDSRHEITSIQAPYDEPTRRIDGRQAEVKIERTKAQRDDIALLVATSGDDLGLSLVTFDPDGNEGDEGYFMATLSASSELLREGALDRQMTIVIDRSGSMSGSKMEQAKVMLRQTIASLVERDTFNLISFSRDTEPLFATPRAATRENRDEALRFVDRLVADGDTNIEAALRVALEQPTRSGRPHAIVFVTDGLPTRGERDIDALLQLAKGSRTQRDDRPVTSSRIFSFGVGYDVNTRLLDGIARNGDGESGYVRPSEDISDVVGGFVAGLASPLVTGLQLDFGDQVTDLHPRILPDLYPGRPITVFGRFSSTMSQEVTLRGQARSGSVRTSFGAEFGSSTDSANAAFVGNLWAARQVADLLDTIRIDGATPERVRTVTEVATRWGIVTPYTSFLVTPEGQGEEDEGGEGDGEEEEPDFEPMRHHIRGGVRSERSMEAVRDESYKPSPRAAVRREAAPKASRQSEAAAAAPAAEVGRQAVEDSLARNRSRSSLRAESSNSSRFASGRSFSRHGEVWVEAGLGNRSPDRRIVAWSHAYFELLRSHPELREALALGEQVRLRLGNEVIEVSAR